MINVDLQGNRPLKRWYDDLFTQYIGNLLLQEFRASGVRFDPPQLFQKNQGKTLFLIPNCESIDAFEGLQEKLRDNITKLNEGFENATGSVWLVYFSYSSLIREMKIIKFIEEEDLERIGQETIINTAIPTFEIASLLMNAEHSLHNRDYYNARDVLMKAAEGKKDSPFIYRRLFDAFAGLGEWASALEYASEAVKIEDKIGSNFAGSYFRLARANESMKNYPEAFENYEKAARLNLGPRYQLEYARGSNSLWRKRNSVREGCRHPQQAY